MQCHVCGQPCITSRAHKTTITGIEKAGHGTCIADFVAAEEGRLAAARAEEEAKKALEPAATAAIAEDSPSDPKELAALLVKAAFGGVL